MESHSVCGVVYMSMAVRLLLTHVYVCVPECMQVWEDIAIKEESETGTTVESTIQLPTQVLCNASVSCCGSYSLPTSCGRPVHSIVDLLANCSQARFKGMETVWSTRYERIIYELPNMCLQLVYPSHSSPFVTCYFATLLLRNLTNSQSIQAW